MLEAQTVGPNHEIRLDFFVDHDLFGYSHRVDDGQYFTDGSIRHEAFRMQIDVAGLDFGKIQNVIDEREKMSRTFENMIKLTFLFLVELSGVLISQQLRKTDDRVQWGSQLVAHVGQEFAFQPVGPLNFAIAQFQHTPFFFQLCCQFLYLFACHDLI